MACLKVQYKKVLYMCVCKETSATEYKALLSPQAIECPTPAIKNSHPRASWFPIYIGLHMLPRVSEEHK